MPDLNQTIAWLYNPRNSLLLILLFLLTTATRSFSSESKASDFAGRQSQRGQVKPAKVYCRGTEACLYGFPKTATYFQYKIVPTWCRCRLEESCDFSHRDPAIKGDVYRCFGATSSQTG